MITAWVAAVVEEQGVGVEVVVYALGPVVAGTVPAHGEADWWSDPGTTGSGQ